MDDQDKPAPKPTALSSSPGKTSLKANTSPHFKATPVVLNVEEDDFLDSIDISELEADLK